VGLCKESLQERARDAVADGLVRAGYRTLEQIDWESEEYSFPEYVDELPLDGVTFSLMKGQGWRKDFETLQAHFFESDKSAAKYLGLTWCSSIRQLVVFDSRSYRGGAYAFSDFAKRI
jgi:hypothetical protein